MNDQEFEAVSNLAGNRRYAYAIKKIADWGIVWSLGADDGWVLAGDAEGSEVVPIWPHPQFAAACALGSWVGNAPRPIELAAWLEKWIPGMMRDQRRVAVFPTPTNKGIVVSATRLKDDLEAELSLIE